MTPVDAIARIQDLQVLATLAATSAIGCAAAFWRHARQVDRERERGCSECSHCRGRWESLQHERRMKQEEEARRNLRYLGLSDEKIEEEIRKRKDKR